MIPDIVVYPTGSGFAARDPLESKPRAQGSSAAKVIQEALDSLPSTGGSVGLRTGTYPLDAPVRIPSRSSFVGSGRSSRLVVTPANKEGTGIRLDGVEGVSVKDLAVFAHRPGTGSCGIALEESGDSRLSDLYLHGFAEHGVALRPGCFLVTVSRCTAAGCNRSGFYATRNTRTRVGEFVPLLFESCTAYLGKTGFELERAIVANFVGCIAYQTGLHGFHIHHHANSVVVSGCRTFQVGGNALRIDTDTHEIHAVGNIFCWQRDHGVFIEDASWGTITGNNIIDSGTRTADGSLRHGVVLAGKTQGVTMTGNAVFNWGDQPAMASGIVEAETCRFNAFVANNLNYMKEKDLLTKGSDSTVADNVSNPESAYIGMTRPPYPDFITAPMEAFFRKQ